DKAGRHNQDQPQEQALTPSDRSSFLQALRSLRRAYSISARMLCRIQGVVRDFDEIKDRFHARACLRNPDADRRRNGVRSNRQHAGLDLLTKSFGNNLGFRHLRFRKQQQELLAAEARYNIGFALLLPANLGNLHDNVVAGIVTKLIVDGFELIDIEHEQRYRPPMPLVAAPLHFSQREKMPAIEQPGHAVDRGEFLELFGLLDQIGHIGVDEHPATVRERLAGNADDLTAIDPDVARILDAGANQHGALLDEFVEFGGRHRARLPADDKPHQALEIEFGHRRHVGQVPHLHERPIDELRAKILVEKDDADIDLVQGAAQRVDGLTGWSKIDDHQDLG
ncbi:MAG: hypothetical protein WCF49_14205, partial [Xanthobacteraceae bacterium]